MKKPISILVSGAFIFSALVNASPALAADSVQRGFNPNKLIDDRVFHDTSTFSGPEGIQSFLQSKGSVLANTSPDFVATLREPSSTTLKETVEDPHPNASKLRTAAELIYDAAKASGLNPQVILVTLNKEQSLITGRQNSTPEQLQRALDFAMGFGCPDSQPCGEIYRGFYGQLFGGVDAENNRYLGAAKSLMKSFNTQGGRGPLYNGAIAKVGDTITLGNTLGGYEGVEAEQRVTIGNSATAALYRYTPHVFNGNYNFWRFFTSWFGSTGSGGGNGLVKRSSKLYMIKDGKKFTVLSFVAKANNWSSSDADRISSSELKAYPDGGYLAPDDNALIKVDDLFYVFVAGVKRQASEFVLKQRGLNTRRAISVRESDANKFTTGAVLTPSEGSVLRGTTTTETYLVEGGVLKQFTPETLVQRNAEAQVQIVPDEELNTYPKSGFVTAASTNRLVKGTAPTVYLIENGQKTALSYDMFVSRGFSFANVVTVSDAELNGYPLVASATTTTPTPTPTPSAPPTTTTWFSNVKTGEFWVWLSGAKHLISPFVAKQKGMTPDVQFDEAYINSLPVGKPIMPREGTIIKGTKPDVYLISGGLAQPMTYAAFVAHGITPAQISILPQAEVDGYPKGAVLTK